MTAPVTVESLYERIASDDFGCRIWTGSLSSQGYGSVKIAGRSLGVHRVVYELEVGPIPDGLHLDHLCRNRACCNPAHLEPVTRKENILRGTGAAARNAAKTHCKRGHEFTLGNTTYIDTGAGRSGRRCLTCYPTGNGRKVA